LAEAVATNHDKGFGAVRFILSLIISSTVVWGVSGGVSQLYLAQSQQQIAQAPSSF